MRDEVFEWRAPKPRPQSERWTQTTVIDAVLAAYRECAKVAYALTSVPDQLNRASREVDAVAHAPGAPPLAIEHTQIQSFAGQLMDDKRVNDLLAEFQLELASDLPRGLWCIIPVHAFIRGFDWLHVRGLIADFLRQTASNFSARSAEFHIEGVPFPVVIKRNPELNTSFRFARFAPSGEQRERELIASTEKALLHKQSRMDEYAAAGYRTVLVLESADMSLMSHVEGYRAFLRAEKTVGSDHAADVIFCETEDPFRIYCFAFKGDRTLLDNMNMPNLRLGQHHAHEWRLEES